MTRRTKIVCTLGPASWEPAVIESLIEAGMDVARVNFSHGTLEQHAATIRSVRGASDRLGRPVAVLADLQGPKIRVGELPEPLELSFDDVIVFAPEGENRGSELPTTYPELASELAPGDSVLLADGLLELVVVEVMPPRVTMRVINGGPLSSHKGINLPGVNFSTPSLTEKDLVDLEFALAHDVDYVALSFVREAADVVDLQSRIPAGGPLVVVKLEKGVALDNLDEILEVSASAMVARGDLGVELPFEKVPLAQKRIIQLANQASRPVITATQMLESMITAPVPTRAEVSDVATAVFEGADAVMLSAESAAGEYPVEAVKSMVRIAAEIEQSHVLDAGPRYDLPAARRVPGASSVERAIAGATVEAVRRLAAPVIVTFTRTGFTARQVASLRPPVPIVAITPSPRTYRQLALVWGVVPVLTKEHLSYEEMLEVGRRAVLDRALATPGECIVLTAGMRINEAGGTNLLVVETL
ncbi:MAG: pyruvate kinase [Gemmatimonadetes bacterium]|nr:pyruvate kinase [Gemmatimonadota bacterium]